MSAVRSNRSQNAKSAGFKSCISLSLRIIILSAVISTSAFSAEIKGKSTKGNFYVPITLENATDVKLVQTLSDHLAQVWTVAFSPDGKLLASCGQDGKVLVRNIDSLSISKQMGGFSYWVVGLAFSPDSHYLAYGGALGFSGSVGPIGLWNVTADTLERSWSAHNGGCWSLDFQESTGLLVSGSFDRTVKLWNPLTGTPLDTLRGHSDAVLSVDFNPQQNMVASSGIDYTVRLWNSQTGNPVRVLYGHEGNVGYVKFSPDGLTVASSADDGTVRLWNVADGSQIWSRDAGQGWVNCANFNSDGTLILTCGHDGSVALRDAATGLQLKRLEGHQGPVIRGAFNPEGTLFATASWDRTVRLWGIERDSDSDGVADIRDNCPSRPNPNQEDADADHVGDSCDNCPHAYNPGQEDSNGDGIGDVCDFICGDANRDHIANVSDAVWVINYVFAGGPPPNPLASGDANCDGISNVSDAVWIITYVFVGGPAPCDCP